MLYSLPSLSLLTQLFSFGAGEIAHFGAGYVYFSPQLNDCSMFLS